VSAATKIPLKKTPIEIKKIVNFFDKPNKYAISAAVALPEPGSGTATKITKKNSPKIAIFLECFLRVRAKIFCKILLKNFHFCKIWIAIGNKKIAIFAKINPPKIEISVASKSGTPNFKCPTGIETRNSSSGVSDKKKVCKCGVIFLILFFKIFSAKIFRKFSHFSKNSFFVNSKLFSFAGNKFRKISDTTFFSIRFCNKNFCKLPNFFFAIFYFFIFFPRKIFQKILKKEKLVKFFPQKFFVNFFSLKINYNFKKWKKNFLEIAKK